MPKIDVKLLNYVYIYICKLIHSCNSKISLAFSQAAPWMLRDGAAKRKAKELHVDAKRREPPKHCNQRELKKSTKSAKPSSAVHRGGGLGP